MKIIHFDEIDSTNEYCKRAPEGNVIVVADRQSGGRGTKGRSFASDVGGAYVSVMRRYNGFPAKDAFKIMVDSCVAVCETLKSLGLSPVIRWANDVLVNGKKICGTLIENSFSGVEITRSIVGVGLNVNNVLPPELEDIATSISKELGAPADLERVRDTLIGNLQRGYDISRYREYINWLGGTVTLKTADGEFQAVARGVEDDGRLVVEQNGKIIKISSAEVSLRL